MRKLFILFAALTFTVPLIFYGCGSGDSGSAGASAPTTGTVSGTVIDNGTSPNQPLSAVSVWWTLNQGGASVPAQTTTTDASGNYSLTNVPIGGVYVYMSKAFYTPPGGVFVGVGGGLTTQVSATMSEASSGAPSISVAAQAPDNTYKFGNTVTVAASVNYSGLTDPNDNVSSLTYTWSNATSPKLTSTGVEYGKVVGGSGAAANSAQVTFPTLAVAFSPRPAATQPGANVSGYKIPDQFGVLPIFPDTRGSVTVKFTVKDSRGQSFSPPNLALNAESIVANTRNVAQNTRIYLNGGDNASYNWTGTGPVGAVAFDNAASRTPSFRTSAGKYTVAVNGKSMDIFAGSYSGGLIANPTIKKGDLVTDGTPADLLKDGTATDPSNTNCICHYSNPPVSANAKDKINTWVTTRHAKIFTQNVATNADPPGEGRTCIVCHSVGYDEGVPGGNGGFAQKMYAFDNLFFPYGVNFGNLPDFWKGLFDNVTRKPMAQLANIQCENCHGPNGATIFTTPHGSAATVSDYNNPRISFAAEVCAPCHGRTSHNFYSQWATLGTDNIGHSNLARAQAEVPPPTGANSCGRCHTAQGFLVYLDQLADNNIGYLNNLQATQVSFAGLGPDNVAPITCTACHDPHNVAYLKNPDGTPKINPDTGRQETNNQLRLYNDTPLLSSGFRVTGFGKGAICVACHNSRRGATTDNTVGFLHEDTDTTPFASWESWGTPHESAQGDSFTGRNAYFVSTPMMSRHAAIEDTCVMCHMARNPNVLSETVEFGNVNRTAKSHTFAISKDKGLTILCANCHGEDAVNGEGIQASTLAGLSALKDTMSAQMLSYLNAKGAVTLRIGTDNVLANAITSATYTPSGTGGTTFTFKYPGSPAAGRTSTLYLSSSTGSAATVLRYFTDNTFLFPPGSNMWKAAWNYSVVVTDASEGIHNPSFTQAVLGNTRAKDLKTGAN